MMRIAARNRNGNAEAVSIDDNGVKTMQVRRQVGVTEGVELAPNQEYTTDRLSTGRYTKGTLNLRMSNTRKIEVYIQYSHSDGVPTGPKELLYRSDGTQNTHTISYPLAETLYQLTIKNVATDGNIGVGTTSVITLSYDDDVMGTLRKESKRIIESIELLKEGIIENSPNKLKIKYPNSKLTWNKTSEKWRDFTVGHDGRHYLIDLNYTIKVYDDLIDGEEEETGITLDEEIRGVRKFCVLPEGITYFTNTDDEEVAIYHAKDINTQPSMVYKSSTQTKSEFTRNFGISGYTDGLNSILLAGVYGTGQDKKPLVLSTDGGQTFNVVKETQNIDGGSSYNSHWHDVAIDAYHGYLWASEGDGQINRAVWYSDDLGRNWNKIKNGEQPTNIVVFPKNVSLGRDSDLVGIDNISKHTLLDEEMIVEPLREFKNQTAFDYFANQAVVRDLEGYFNFTLYTNSDRPILVGTGDGGESWHGLGFGVSNVDHLFGIDDDRVYARGFDGHIYYFKRIKWE